MRNRGRQGDVEIVKRQWQPELGLGLRGQTVKRYIEEVGSTSLSMKSTSSSHNMNAKDESKG